MRIVTRVDNPSLRFSPHRCLRWHECLLTPFFFLDSPVSVFTTSAAFKIDQAFTPRFLKSRILPQFFEPGFLLLGVSSMRSILRFEVYVTRYTGTRLALLVCDTCSSLKIVSLRDSILPPFGRTFLLHSGSTSFNLSMRYCSASTVSLSMVALQFSISMLIASSRSPSAEMMRIILAGRGVGSISFKS
jgi:hypothetical protein